MKTAKQVRREAKQLFRSCLVNGTLDQECARQVLQKVLQSSRRGQLALLRQFHRLVELDYARRTANVESAVPLPVDLQAAVRAGLEAVYGTGINTLFAQNTGLIGGMRIKVGSDVYDGSVRSSLAALEKSFA